MSIMVVVRFLILYYKIEKFQKSIHLRHLSADCVKLIKKAEKICDVNVLEDPDYFVAIDNYRQLVSKTD